MNTRHRFTAAALSALLTLVMLVAIDSQATAPSQAPQMASAPALSKA